MAEIKTTESKDLIRKLEVHYAEEVEALQKLGFAHLAYVTEDHGPFSALKKLLIIPIAKRSGEIVLIRWPFRLVTANVLMKSADPPSLALCMGLGIKFYSVFEDGSIIVSTDFHSRLVPRPQSNFTRVPTQPTMAATWAAHKAEAVKRAGQVDYLSKRMTVGDYVLISTFEEDPTQFEFV